MTLSFFQTTPFLKAFFKETVNSQFGHSFGQQQIND